MKILNTLLSLTIVTSILKAQNPEVSSEDFSSRQVHLDFHTSEQLENIGEKFDKASWQKALVDAHVSSINIFAKGHHGFSYYPTKVGTQHPNLGFDLLKSQLEASHEIGIKTPFYFAIGWSALDAVTHPEWVIKNKNGKSKKGDLIQSLNAEDPYPNFTWELLMPEGGYLEMILKQTEELCKNYELDGFWYDIIPNNAINYNAYSRAGFKKAGIDVDNDLEVEMHHVEKLKFFMASCNAIIKKYHPDASIFYNWSTHMNNSNTFKYKLYEYNTSYDLEDLPTTWEGYNEFPLRAKYFSNMGKPVTGMSGKFHTAWGEFGGFKYPNALKYEAASMIAFGANVNFGDQLHPSGIIDSETYKNIGSAFSYVKSIEAFGPGGKQVAKTGLWMTFDNHTEQAASLLLLDTQTNYVVVNNLKDWSDLELIIIPSKPNLSAKNVETLNQFVADGGKLLILGEGALKRDRSGFALDVGGTYLGKASYDVDYTVVSEALSKNVVRSPFLNYMPAIKIKPDATVKLLASIREPYFSRTKAHYTSHQNTPYNLQPATHPAIYRDGNTMVVAHPLDKMYLKYGAQIHRELFKNTLDALLTTPMVRANLPSSGRVNLLHFPEKNRYVAHLLYAVPVQRGVAQVIDDLVPIYDTTVEINLKENIKKAYLMPGNIELNTTKSNDKMSVIIPKFTCHTALVLEY
ncbi:MAG: hypothetical protein CMC56_02405 [Flavobacteriaceae bacterium]|nr:hypothetical protein [Flavobacteriaceae bacterium]